MEGVLLQNRVVLLELNALGGILPVLGGDIAAHAGLAGGLMLCALENYLYAVAFLCHDRFRLDSHALGARFFQHRRDAPGVDGFNGRGGYFQSDPFALLGDKKALRLQVRVEPALRLVIRVGNLVSSARTLSCDFANPGHN